MDPKACLDRALDAFTSGDYEGCYLQLEDYWDWRQAGGFEPRKGDARAREIGRDLRLVHAARLERSIMNGMWRS